MRTRGFRFLNLGFRNLRTMRAGINTFRIPSGLLDVNVLVLNSISSTKNIFHVCVFVPVTTKIPAKSAGYVCQIQKPDGAQTCLRMCMCIEFVIQVLEQKNAHVGTEKKHDSHRCDRILRFFLRLEIGQVSPHFGAISLLNYIVNLEKREKIHWRKLKKIPCRRRPEIADFCPLSWSNVSRACCMCLFLLRWHPKIGIMPGWHGMENGQKPEMDKKMEIEMENGPKLDRWPFSISISIFFHFRLLAIFHTIP